MPYGLPSGAELRAKILNEVPLSRLPIPPNELHPHDQPNIFRNSFRKAHCTIDQFLGSRPEFTSIGKLAIAEALFPCEQIDIIEQGPESDNWYKILTDELHANWDDLEKNEISIATFNYDRSLETYLLQRFINFYGQADNEAMAMLGRFKIVHFYGSLGSLDPESPDFTPYGAPGDATQRRQHLLRAAANISIIPEHRDSSCEFQRAQALISNADTLFFLGFGFDKTNLERLLGSKGFPDKPGRHVFASGFDKTDEELREIAAAMKQSPMVDGRALLSPISSENPYLPKMFFWREKNAETLRNSPSLSRRSI